jgi:hypothetical protein
MHDSPQRLMNHRRDVERTLRQPQWQRQFRRRWLTVFGVAAALLIVVVGSRPAVRHCEMFASAEQAQEYLRAHPEQVAWLDVDGDGHACA